MNKAIGEREEYCKERYQKYVSQDRNASFSRLLAT
jgi:hypothetical protein